MANKIWLVQQIVSIILTLVSVSTAWADNSEVKITPVSLEMVTDELDTSGHIAVSAEKVRVGLKRFSDEYSALGIKVQLVKREIPGWAPAFVFQVLPDKGHRINNMAAGIFRRSQTVMILDPNGFNLGYFSGFQVIVSYKITPEQFRTGEAYPMILHEIRHWSNFQLINSGKLEGGNSIKLQFPNNSNSGVPNYRSTYSLDEVTTYSQQIRMMIDQYLKDPTHFSADKIDAYMNVLGSLLGSAEGALSEVKKEKNLPVQKMANNIFGAKDGYATYRVQAQVIDFYFIGRESFTSEEASHYWMRQLDLALNALKDAGAAYDILAESWLKISSSKKSLSKSEIKVILDQASSIKEKFQTPFRAKPETNLCSKIFYGGI